MSFTFLLFLLITIISPSHSAGNECLPLDKSGEPRFTQTLANIDYVPVHQFIRLLCCAGGVDSILWYRLEQGVWNMFPWSGTAQLKTQDNQTMEITSADDRDNTTFKCVPMKNGLPVLENKLQLYVMRCDGLARGPLVTAPYPVNPQIDSFGETVSIPCTGYFGCTSNSPEDKFFRTVQWRVKGTKGNISKVNSRYVTSTHKSPDLIYISSNLTIKSVQPKDLEKTFVCHLSSPQMHHGHTSKEIHIVKIEKPSYTIIIIIVVSVAVFVLFIVIFILCLRRYYWPQIRVRMTSHIKILAGKPIKDNSLELNAFIYHASDDTSYAMEIKKQLEKRNILTEVSHEILANECEVTAIQKMIRKSAMVLLVYSQNLLDDNMANMVISSLIRDSLEKSIIFIVIDQFSVEDVKNWAEDENDVQEDGPNCQNDRNNRVKIDLKFWKALPQYRYPTNNATDREKNYFFCSLYNKIPKFEYQIIEMKKNKRTSVKRSPKARNSSSSTPLIESPLSSPNGIENMENRSPDTEITQNFCYDDETIIQRNTNNSVESENDPNPSVVVNVDIHQNEPKDERNKVLHAFENHRHLEPCGTQPMIQDDTRGSACIEPHPEVGVDENRMSAELSNHDTSESIFTLSGEEPTNRHDTAARSEDKSIDDVTGRTCPVTIEAASGASSENTISDHLSPNGNLHVEIRGNGQTQNGNCSSPDDGYTSLSPPPLGVEDSSEFIRKQTVGGIQNIQQHSVL